MSPHRRHSGGRPRSAHSILDVAERWGISVHAARRLAAQETRRRRDGDFGVRQQALCSRAAPGNQPPEKIHRWHESPGHAKPRSCRPCMSREPAILLPARRRLVKDYARTRFGLCVDKQVRQSLIRRVRKGDVKYARKLTNSRTVIVLDYEGDEMAFLYSSASKEIISFLSPDAPETADWRRSQSAAVKLVPRSRVRRDWSGR